MSLVRYLFYFLFLHVIVAFPQINLDLTDWISNNESDVVFEHDCLHVTGSIENGPHELISYCLSEWSSKWNIEKSNLDHNFTFAELSQRNISSEQLYLWSAPIDTIERYQFYLNQRLTSSEMSKEFFYNCTLPIFGPMCQYSFDDYQSHLTSLNQFISHFYFNNKYQPMNLTCYTHLKCDRGTSSACLDWSDICDRKIDCLNNGIDEEQCWQIEINECQNEEFRCDIGQCISETFLHDDPNVPDCLDATDEGFNLPLKRLSCDRSEPSFGCEDVTCTPDSTERWRYYPNLLTSSCYQQRTDLLLKEIFSERPNSTSDDCWSAFKCIIHMSADETSACQILCQDEACSRIIESTCPDMIYAPAIPILFGHIYLAYTKSDSRYEAKRPRVYQYVCYNDQLCGGFLSNITLISLNNSTCRRAQDFPLKYELIMRQSWLITYVSPLHKQLYKCNTIIRNDSQFCNKSSMYQCLNSSKCISKYRVHDGFNDCDYNDDEDPILLESTYSIQGLKKFIKCTTENKYIHRNRFGDGHCDCLSNEYWLCDDERPDLHYARKHISFGTICDGFIELIPLTINGINETDETGCEYWPCNNLYTRCDGFWNCFNGADEVDCDSSPLLNCPPRHHICVSPETNQLMCLPLEKANDEIIDCLGATDEPKVCRVNNYKLESHNFYCRNHSAQFCMSLEYVCDYYERCMYADDEQACSNTDILPAHSNNMCEEQYTSIRTDVEEFFCRLHDDIHKPKIVQFSLDRIQNSIKDRKDTVSQGLPPIQTSNPQHCHRGLPLRVWLNKEKNVTIITCLCPPSFYGDMCQYQNQRVTLTMQFRPFSDSRQTPFAIVMSLIDDSDQRTIHSHQQMTYLPTQHCQKKFNVYLLYSTRPKNETNRYSVHIDFYHKISLTYQGSVVLPIQFSFLPVYRIAVHLNIPRTTDKSCLDEECVHGKCIRYFDDPKNNTFCQCNRGWSGRYCTISHTCMCSSDSLCLGVSANNRSLCVCPIYKWGSQCLLYNQICQSSQNSTRCENGGQCIPIDPYVLSNKTFECICPKGFFGDICEINDNKMLLSFEEDILLPQIMFIHFIEVMKSGPPEHGTTFKNILFNQNSFLIYWSRPFHIAFVEFNKKNYYLIVVQNKSNRSITIVKRIKSTDRCPYFKEMFNETITQSDLINRIKSYHLPCQRRSPPLSCFYDDDYICLCNDFDDQRHANCFEFNHNLNRDCFGRSNCENGAQCLQDSATCSKTSICVCPPCFYGALCQFSSDGFSLSLDAILGYHITPHIHILRQSPIVQMSVVLVMIMTIAGVINGILSVITFNNKSPQKSGCGLYLLGSSITTIVTMIIFALKFWILIVAQMSYMTNRSFLHFQCIYFDFLLRVGLNMDQWLNACVAIERANTAFKGITFNKKKSKTTAKYIIVILLVMTISTAIHDPFNRRLIDDGDDANEKRIWCIITYSHNFQIYNSVMNIFHLFSPFLINLISGIYIIRATAKQRITVQSHRSYVSLLRAQLKQHRHLLFAPLILISLAVPRLIISFVSGCMKSSRDSWLFLIGYFISFIPPMLTFVVFVLPSKTYMEEFQKCVRRYRQMLRTCLHLT